MALYLCLCSQRSGDYLQGYNVWFEQADGLDRNATSMWLMLCMYQNTTCTLFKCILFSVSVANVRMLEMFFSAAVLKLYPCEFVTCDDGDVTDVECLKELTCNSLFRKSKQLRISTNFCYSHDVTLNSN